MPAIAVVAGTVISAVASKKAAKKQSQAAEAGIAEQQRQSEVTQAQQQPYLDAGTRALGRLENPAANFTTSPGYEFARSEGTRGIENSFAARGGAASGNAMKALAEFNAGLASGEYGNWWNQQAGLAGVGQNSANTLGVLGQRNADNIGTLKLQQGDARASGIEGVGNALIYGASQGYGAWKDRQPGVSSPTSVLNDPSKRPKKAANKLGYNPWAP